MKKQVYIQTLVELCDVTNLILQLLNKPRFDDSCHLKKKTKNPRELPMTTEKRHICKWLLPGICCGLSQDLVFQSQAADVGN